MRTALFFLVAITLLAAPARADRYTRGQVAFHALCDSCHAAGWRQAAQPVRGRSDLTRVVDRLSDAQLRAFLAGPKKVRRDTGCDHAALDAAQVDDLLFFLHMRAQGEPQKPRIPPRSNNPQLKPRAEAAPAAATPAAPVEAAPATPTTKAPAAPSANPSAKRSGR